MKTRRGFTLIELMSVIGILGLLISILLPALGQAQAFGRSIQCRSNLKSIGIAMLSYQSRNDGCVVPSYNMVGSARGDNNPLDGWPAILDRDGVMPASARGSDTAFWCPDTRGDFGMSGGTIDPDGFQYWPVSSADQTLQQGVTIPEHGFNKIIRCSYWINGNNPIGTSKTTGLNDVYYTGSVGYFAAGGPVLRPTDVTAFKRPQSLIAVTDGVYAGQQSAVRIGEDKRRISFRHPGNTTNALFADGHGDSIPNDQFPHAKSGTIPLDQVRAENMGRYTLYANPAASLAN